jgi:hypothetical protein
LLCLSESRPYVDVTLIDAVSELPTLFVSPE